VPTLDTAGGSLRLKDPISAALASELRANGMKGEGGPDTALSAIATERAFPSGGLPNAAVQCALILLPLVGRPAGSELPDA
jgi:hypothetical protein